MVERIKIIGVPISAVNMESCVEYIFDNWSEAKGNYICVSNVHTTVMAHDDPCYHRVQSESFLTVPDGKPLSVVGRRKAPMMGRVTGPDLMRRILEESEHRELRHFFYGNTQETLQLLINEIRFKYPWVNVVGSEASVFRDMSVEEEEALAQRIEAQSPDFIWVSLGAPRQESFCWRMKGKLSGLMIPVGGAFNVLAGSVPEAPRWLQECGMEWFYRLIQEPKRLMKRYLVSNTKFIVYFIFGIKAKVERGIKHENGRDRNLLQG